MAGYNDHLDLQDFNLYGLKEHQLVNAWRNPFAPSWTPESRELAIIHRVHLEDQTVTVQFLKDQNRIRMHVAAVTQVDKTPHSYPAKWIHPGDAMPTATQCQAAAVLEEEHRAHLERMGHPMAPRFQQKDLDLPPKRVEQSDRWGIPAPTLIALRNRSIPMSEVTGLYDQHFYSKLYENNFYPTKAVQVSDKKSGNMPGEATTINHIYVPLNGPPKQQMKDGGWRELPPQECIPRYC